MEIGDERTLLDLLKFEALHNFEGWNDDDELLVIRHISTIISNIVDIEMDRRI